MATTATQPNEQTKLVRYNAERVLSLIGIKNARVYWVDNQGQDIGYVQANCAYSVHVSYGPTNTGDRKPKLEMIVKGWDL